MNNFRDAKHLQGVGFEPPDGMSKHDKLCESCLEIIVNTQVKKITCNELVSNNSEKYLVKPSAKAGVYGLMMVIFTLPSTVFFVLSLLGGGAVGFIWFLIFLVPLIVFAKLWSKARPKTNPHYHEIKINPDYQSFEITKSTLVSETDLQNGFANFSWREMEELTGKLFEKKGYSVEVTKSTSDFGIDVWAERNGEKIGIQVKKWKNDVGFDEVTKTLGSNLGKANKYILISTISFFTNQAWEHQRQHSHLIELWDTNRFRKELRDNFIKQSNSNKPVTPIQDTKIDSFDYDQGFNIEEVYSEQDDSLPEIGDKCTKCGSPVFRNFCGNCGKEHESKM